MKIRIYYTIWDGDDGSASVEFHKSQEEMNTFIEERESDEDTEWSDMSEGGCHEDIETSDYECMENGA